jgi:hypothetical protein
MLGRGRGADATVCGLGGVVGGVARERAEGVAVGSGVDAAVTKKVFVGSGKEEREENKKSKFD